MRRKKGFRRSMTARSAMLLIDSIFVIGCNQQQDNQNSPIVARLRAGTAGSDAAGDASNTPDPITLKWRELGGESVVGAATSEILWTPDSLAQYQTFTNGVIVYSDDSGARYITQAIFDHWLALRSTNTPDGRSVYTYLGAPAADVVSRAGYTESTHDVPGDYTEVTFLGGGVIIVDPSGTARAIYGMMDGPFQSWWSTLGEPTSELSVGPSGGHYQAFAHGYLFAKSSDAYAVPNGIISDQWRALGGLVGLGYPTADVTLQNGVYSGRFEEGVIYGSDTVPALAIPFAEPYGSLLKAYENTYGGALGWLGLPTGRGVSSGGRAYLDCQNGVVVMDNSTPRVFGNLRFHLEQFWGTSGDWVTSTDTYVYLNLLGALHHVLPNANHERLPLGGGDCTVCTINGDWDLPSVGHSSFEVTATIEGHDSNFGFWSSDGDLGTITQVYNIDNLWGFQGVDNFHHASGPDGNIAANFWINNTYPCPSNDYRQCSYWKFHNFNTPNVDWTAYALAFDDVDPDENHWRHPMNWLYYTAFVDSAAANGNCFGMTLEAIYDQVGRGYAEPVHQWERSSSLDEQINVRHIQQLGASEVLWALETFGLGNTHDPEDTYQDGKSYEGRGDYTLLSIFDSYLFGSGHTVRAYKYQDDKIYIADSDYNITSDTDPPGPERFIEITTGGDEAHPYSCFSYPGTSYNGCTLSGGRMFFTPFSKVSGRQLTPLGALNPWELIKDGYYWITSGALAQATDDQGRTLFKTGLTGLPTRWDDLESGDNQIPTLAPIPIAGEAPLNGQIYGGIGVSGATHRYEVVGTTAGQDYETGLSSSRLTAHFSVPGTPDKADIITMRRMNLADKAVAFKLPSDGVEKTITATASGFDTRMWGQLRSLRVVPNQEIAIQTRNGGKTFVVSNDGPPTTACLRFTDSTTNTVSDGLCPFPIDTGTTTIPMAPPVARCKDLGRNDPSNCTSPPNVDNGSYDPQGSGLTYDQSPSVLQVGPNRVTLTVRNQAGFSASCAATVTVFDTTPPHFTAVPPDVASDPCTGDVGSIGTASAADNCGGAVVVTNDAPATYPQGVTIVTWTATDASGNSRTYQQRVTRTTDTTPPEFTVRPANVVSDPCTGTVGPIGAAAAVDNCGGVPTITNDAPSSYPRGVTTVTWRATDSSGNSSTYQQTITVTTDATPPTFTVRPSNVSSDPCTGAVGSIGQAQTSDNCPGAVTVTNDAPSSYPRGVTTVTWRATDSSGNSSTYQQTVTVTTDTTPPTFTVRPSNVSSDPCTGAVGSIGQAQASDNCPGAVTVTNDAPASYPRGVTTVTWTATDTSGNLSTYQQTVTVTTDTTPPHFTSAPANVVTTVCTGVTSIGTASASDNCGAATVTNNAPATFPIGTTTVTWTATDTAGNKTTYQQTVRLDEAVDLGQEKAVSSVSNSACLKVTEYPASWAPYMHTIVVQPQATGVGFPIPFTWKNCGATGSGSLPGPWLQGTVQPMNTSCQTLIKLGGNGAGPVSLTWWGNG